MKVFSLLEVTLIAAITAMALGFIVLPCTAALQSRQATADASSHASRTAGYPLSVVAATSPIESPDCRKVSV